MKIPLFKILFENFTQFEAECQNSWYSIDLILNINASFPLSYFCWVPKTLLVIFFYSATKSLSKTLCFFIRKSYEYLGVCTVIMVILEHMHGDFVAIVQCLWFQSLSATATTQVHMNACPSLSNIFILLGAHWEGSIHC
jgi:hypothetical protein